MHRHGLGGGKRIAKARAVQHVVFVAEMPPGRYRTEVLAMLGALADLVVDVRAIREAFEDEEEEEGK